MRPENWLLTQSSLKRLGAAIRSACVSSSNATGASGLIHVLNCCGVSSRSSCAAAACQKSCIVCCLVVAPGDRGPGTSQAALTSRRPGLACRTGNPYQLAYPRGMPCASQRAIGSPHCACVNSCVVAVGGPGCACATQPVMCLDRDCTPAPELSTKDKSVDNLCKFSGFLCTTRAAVRGSGLWKAAKNQAKQGLWPGLSYMLAAPDAQNFMHWPLWTMTH
ncbi:hypothetical protein D3C81_968190 [compost metagenome]